MPNLHRKILRRFRPPMAVTSARVEVGGSIFRTPMVDGYMCEPSEPWMHDLLRKILPVKGGPFLDVGVNLGQTLLAVRAISRDLPYVGVEPNPLCVAYAERMASLNGFQHYSILPAGIGSSAMIARLHLYHGRSVDSSASIVPDFRPDQSISHSVFVPVFPFGDVARAAAISHLGVVKIDVEGAELEVLSSMADAISASAPWVVVEILPCYTADNRNRIDRQQQIEHLMSKLSYDILRIRKDSRGLIAALQPLLEIGIHADLDLCDYLLVPRAERSRLERLLPVTT